MKRMTMGGRHVIKVKRGAETVGQPFRLTATPNGVPLINKTGKSGGGYRLTNEAQGQSDDPTPAQSGAGDGF
ncbi:MAG: hypothetical protein HS126_22010 [Anaerolineales bacterium]|nr:hypothetical protein [Anaerolineales bacterium]